MQTETEPMTNSSVVGNLANPHDSKYKVENLQNDVRAGAAVDGVEISAFAQQEGLSLQAVWAKIRAGELAGRHFGDRFLVYRQTPQFDLTRGFDYPSSGRHRRVGASARDILASATDAFRATEDQPTLPPKPEHAGQALMALPENYGNEIALLLDHLSLAKEEHRELLRFSEESLKRVSAMAENIISLKDTIIGEKESQIDRLKHSLSEKEGSLNQLRQDVEDLEILAKTLSERKARRE